MTDTIIEYKKIIEEAVDAFMDSLGYDNYPEVAETISRLKAFTKKQICNNFENMYRISERSIKSDSSGFEVRELSIKPENTLAQNILSFLDTDD